MAIEQIPLDQIDDNPFNPRKYYHQNKIREMASSLRGVGLLETPEGRRVDGHVQLAFGHYRLRAYRLNREKDPENWQAMPVEVKEMDDRAMFDKAWEENVRRTDVTQIELARMINSYKEMFPDVEDKAIGEKHSMSPENVSNMRRVLRLPQKFLDKIDEGLISFTQGRELLTLEGLPEAEDLMSRAISGLKTGNKQFGEPNTVEGLQKSIYHVIREKYPPIDKDYGSWHFNLLFDTRAAGCLKCERCFITHPTKSQAAHFCIDVDCWQKKTDEHKEKAAAAAKAAMQAEIEKRAAEEAARRAPPPAPEPEPVPEAVEENAIPIDRKTFDKLYKSNSCGAISEGQPVSAPVEFEGKRYLATGGCTGGGQDEVDAYMVIPRAEYSGEVRTYAVPKGRKYDEYYDSLRADPNGFYNGMVVKQGKNEWVLVGPEVTFVPAGEQGDFSQEKSAVPPEVDRRYTFKKKGTTWVGLTPAAVVISINHDKEQAGIEARAYFDPVATILNPSPENFKLNHTYRIIAKSGVEKHTLPGGEPIIDVTAQDLPAALKAMNYTPADVLQVKVFKSSGKLGTDGGVSAGWSKCTESMEQEDETAKLYKERDLESAEAPPMSEEEFAAKANGRPWPGKAPAAPAPAPAKVSEKEIAEAKKAAGTRAEMLDLVDICFESGYQRQMKAGYANLDNERRYIDNPEECFETCTHGFHFAFDTKHPEEKELHICSDPKCLSKKKGAFTRKQNAAGQARKNAEKTAIKQALSKVASVAGLESQDQVVAVMKPVLYLFIYNQLHGANVEDNYYRDDVKKPEKWLWDKLSAGTKSEARKEPALWKLIKKLPDVDLAMLVTEYCFYYLQDHGNVGRYEIKTEQPLSFFDIAISVPVGDTVDKSEAGGEQEEEDEDGDE